MSYVVIGSHPINSPHLKNSSCAEIKTYSFLVYKYCNAHDSTISIKISNVPSIMPGNLAAGVGARDNDTAKMAVITIVIQVHFKEFIVQREYPKLDPENVKCKRPIKISDNRRRPKKYMGKKKTSG
eukprot:232119_1